MIVWQFIQAENLVTEFIKTSVKYLYIYHQTPQDQRERYSLQDTEKNFVKESVPWLKDKSAHIQILELHIDLDEDENVTVSQADLDCSVFSLPSVFFQKPNPKPVFPFNIPGPQSTVSFSLMEATWVWPTQNKILNIQ